MSGSPKIRQGHQLVVLSALVALAPGIGISWQACCPQFAHCPCCRWDNGPRPRGLSLGLSDRDTPIARLWGPQFQLSSVSTINRLRSGVIREECPAIEGKRCAVAGPHAKGVNLRKKKRCGREAENTVSTIGGQQEGVFDLSGEASLPAETDSNLQP
jgi:hypothetical protein